MRSVVVTALLSAAIVAGSGTLGISARSMATQSATPAPIDEEDQDKLTPLMRASARGDLSTVKALLDKRAGPNVQNSTYRVTALMFASYFGYTDIVKTLVAHGARVDLKDAGGAGPIDWAALGGQKHIVRMFEEQRVTISPFLAIGSMPISLMEQAAGKRK